MDDIKEKKNSIRNDMKRMIKSMPEKDLQTIYKQIEDQLFEFANFLESKVPLLYMNLEGEVYSQSIIKKSIAQKKVIVLPVFNKEKHSITLMKVDNFDTDLKMGPRGVLEPNPEACKKVPLDKVDIAIIPGFAFDEKGGRIGTGSGYYDRLIPRLSATTRKVSLIMESQIIPQVPMESHDKYVDIVITEERVIYKI